MSFLSDQLKKIDDQLEDLVREGPLFKVTDLVTFRIAPSIL